MSSKTPNKGRRRDPLLPDQILPNTTNDFAFVRNIPEDPSVLIMQLGWDAEKGV
jgi:hypothetical protein